MAEVRQGAAIKAPGNMTLMTVCANPDCKKEIPANTNSYALSERTTWGLTGQNSNGKRAVFPTCNECYEIGWRPPQNEWF